MHAHAYNNLQTSARLGLYVKVRPSGMEALNGSMEVMEGSDPILACMKGCLVEHLQVCTRLKVSSKHLTLETYAVLN